MREQSTHFNYELLKQVKGAICANCGMDCGQEIIFHHIINRRGCLPDVGQPLCFVTLNGKE